VKEGRRNNEKRRITKINKKFGHVDVIKRC
jgi:hypothetical protein